MIAFCYKLIPLVEKTSLKRFFFFIIRVYLIPDLITDHHFVIVTKSGWGNQFREKVPFFFNNHEIYKNMQDFFS